MQNGPRFLTDQDISTVYTTTVPAGAVANDLGQDQLGARGITADGREFRYANIGGTSSVPAGTLLQQAAAPSNSTALTITAVGTGGQATANLAAGSTVIVLSNTSSTAFTQDQFAGGYLQVTQTSGATTQAAYRISGNSAAGAGNVTTTYITVQLFPTDALRNTVALVAGTDTCNLVYNPWWAVASSTTDLLAAGVLPITAVPASGTYAFAWLQTRGDCLTQLDGTSGGVTAGGVLANSTTTAGDVTAWLGAGLSHGSAQMIGVARATTSASATCSTFLTID
jgi:hypothetical protein